MEVHPIHQPADSSALAELARLVETLEQRGLALELSQANPESRRVELFIASGCSQRCTFCCESERIQRKEFMAFEELDDKLVACARGDTQVVQFMGGEATLHPRFADALRRAKDLGLGTYVITNLLRWEDRAFAEAVGPWLDDIMISVHAHDDRSGEVVTGRRDWWSRFAAAAVNARETLGPRRRASTVLTRHNVDGIEAITDVILTLGVQAWIFGNPVPVRGSSEMALASTLPLADQRALGPRLEAIAARCRASGCRFVSFCMPHCVLPPALRAYTHDDHIDDQDLSETADVAVDEVTFWSRADYLPRTRPIRLGRRRPPVCDPCTVRDRCGGYFSAWLDRHGDEGLVPL